MAVTAGPPYAPPGPPAGPPPAPEQATPWWKSPTLRIVISAVLIVAAIVVFFVGHNSASATTNVALVGKDAPGTDSFTPSVAGQSSEPSALADQSPSSGGLITANGDAAALYAGQRDLPSCNTNQLADYLDGNPATEKAWAEAVNIRPADVRPFIATLTSALLRVDTRVTEYHFVDNKAQPQQSVLQRGTAILLDRTGFPRVRCRSGNPLGQPKATSNTPSYKGSSWPGFSKRRVVVVRPARTTGPFILLDSPTGSIFVRIPGGIADLNVPPTGVTIQLCEPGGPFGVTGSRFPPSAAIALTWDNPAVTLANVTADGSGNFSEQVTCPPNAPIGVHQVQATGGGFTLTQPVFAIPPAPPATP